MVYAFEALIVLLAAFFKKIGSGSPKKEKVIFLIITFSVMAVVSGLRGSLVGEDTRTYLSIFEQCKTMPWKDILNGDSQKIYMFVSQQGYLGYGEIEIGFVIFNKIVAYIWDNPQITIICTSAITCFGFAYFIYKNSDNVFLATFLFLTEGIYLHSFNGVRQYMAIAIGINAYNAIKEKHYWKALLIIVLASAFHNSALIFLIFFVVANIKHAKSNFVLCAFALTIAVMFYKPFLQMVAAVFPQYEAYTTNNFWGSNVGFTSLLWIMEIVICILIAFRYNWKSENIDEKNDVFNITFFSLLYITIELISMNVSAFSRVSLYFRPFIVLLFPKFEKLLQGKAIGWYRAILCGLFLLVFSRYASEPSRLYTFFWKS